MRPPSAFPRRPCHREASPLQWGVPNEPSSIHSSALVADRLLAEMSQVEPATRLARGMGAGVQPPRVRYTHEAMVDLIVENPWISQNQLAAHFGYSPAWISTIITSDAFQARLEDRRHEVIDPEMRLSLRERFQAIVTQSLRVLQEKISKPADQVNDMLVLKTVELGAKALGLGGNAPTPVLVTSEERLSNLAHRLIALRGGQGKDVIDV